MYQTTRIHSTPQNRIVDAEVERSHRPQMCRWVIWTLIIREISKVQLSSDHREPLDKSEEEQSRMV